MFTRLFITRVAGGQGERVAWGWRGDPVSTGAEIHCPGECFIVIYFPTVYSGRKQALVGLNSCFRAPWSSWRGSEGRKGSSEGTGVSPGLLEPEWLFWGQQVLKGSRTDLDFTSHSPPGLCTRCCGRRGWQWQQGQSCSVFLSVSWLQGNFMGWGAAFSCPSMEKY